MHQLKKNKRNLSCTMSKQVLDRGRKSQQINETHALSKIPTNAAHVQNHCIGNKQSIMKNVPVPSTQMNCAMKLIKAQETIKNALVIGFDVCLIKPKLVENGIKSINNNVIGKGKGIQD